MSTETLGYANNAVDFSWGNFAHSNLGSVSGQFSGGVNLGRNFVSNSPATNGVTEPAGRAGGLQQKRRSRSAKLFRNNKKDWVATTKLGRLVKNGFVTSLEEIFRFNVPIQEVEIVDMLAKGQLTERVLTVFPVVKQTAQGTRTRFKVLAAVGDHNGHVGLGIKCYKEVASAIRGAVSNAKLGMVQVIRGKWALLGDSTGMPVNSGTTAFCADKTQLHTIAGKASGESGGAKVRLFPAPFAVGIVGCTCMYQEELLKLAGVTDCFVAYNNASATSSTGNQVKAMLNALHSLSRLKMEALDEEEKVCASLSSGGSNNWC